MITRIVMRRTNLDGTPDRKDAKAALRTAAGSMLAISFIVVSIACGLGGSAAAEEASVAKAGEMSPVSLAGRWAGHYYAYGRSSDAKDCGAGGCNLTYDIVACKEGWCGIAIKDDNTCGAVAVHLSANTEPGKTEFRGKLELAKGAAPYSVAAWYSADPESKAGELHLIGDTGPELMLFRRSFPLEANFTRTGDATCKIDDATS